MRAVVLLLALGCSGCASALVAAEGAIHRSIAVTQDTANGFCDAGLRSKEKCQQFSANLIPVIASAKTFNRAVRENSAAEVPAMLASLVALRDAAIALLEDEALYQQLVERVKGAYGLVAGLRR